VARIGDVFRDQTRLSGHHDREDDLDRFAALGLKTLRYPLIWERIASAPGVHDWRWTDDRLQRLQDLDIRPIAGLLHHGSGPAFTNLLDPAFPALFADFAGQAARRYPHIKDWTPVNEPLTTARFSALYGHWHPHRADERSFWLALLNQIDAVRLGMAEIRMAAPDARLIQTEDLGRTYATRAASHQATFDNQRRWMTWDLLFGLVTPSHPLWSRLERLGLGDRLQAIAEDPCPPDVVGVNHYVTSDRYLDHGVDAYPPERRGGNEFTSFADVEAIRVLTPPPQGLAGALLEAWERYARPLALTECQLGCTRDNQGRWIAEAWRTAKSLRARGVEVQAVTAWALLGAYDWNSLLTRADGYYESGAFDLRSPTPRPTALASVLRRLVKDEPAAGPVTAGEGWWRRDVRLTFSPVFHSVLHPEPLREHAPDRGTARPLLITGGTGVLGQALARNARWRDLAYVLSDRNILDLEDASSIATTLDRLQPWAVINTAGWRDVDQCEQDHDRCRRLNLDGPVRLAAACAARGVPMATFSSVLVFDGRQREPYTETDAPHPVSVYGSAMARAEDAILALGGRSLIIRTDALYSPFDGKNLASQVLHRLSQGQCVAAARDRVITPTYLPSLADAVLDLMLDEETGLWNLSSQTAITCAEFARRLAQTFGFDPNQVLPQPQAAFRGAPMPMNCALKSRRGALLPGLDDGLGRLLYSLRESGFEADAPLLRGQDGPRDRGLACMAPGGGRGLGEGASGKGPGKAGLDGTTAYGALEPPGLPEGLGGADGL
jgi:dTDP-4-dehydrorhamnose reductase